jgi:hypothetical protein
LPSIGKQLKMSSFSPVLISMQTVQDTATCYAFVTPAMKPEGYLAVDVASGAQSTWSGFAFFAIGNPAPVAVHPTAGKRLCRVSSVDPHAGQRATLRNRHSKIVLLMASSC